MARRVSAMDGGEYRFFWSDQKKSRCSSDATHWPDSIMDGGEY